MIFKGVSIQQGRTNCGENSGTWILRSSAVSFLVTSGSFSFRENRLKETTVLSLSWRRCAKRVNFSTLGSFLIHPSLADEVFRLVKTCDEEMTQYRTAFDFQMAEATVCSLSWKVSLRILIGGTEEAKASLEGDGCWSSPCRESVQRDFLSRICVLALLATIG